MQYSPKLKTAMAEIVAVIKKHDVAAHVILHTPGHSEFLNELSPSYSCAKVNGDQMRFRAKKEDFNGNTAARDNQIRNTANMLKLISDLLLRDAVAYGEISKEFDKIVNSEHGPGGLTSNATQNN